MRTRIRRVAPASLTTIAIDLGLVLSTVAAVYTSEVVLWFHLIFVLIVVAALMLPFRPFVVRLVLWSVVSTALVVWAVADLSTPSQELTELPILTFVLVLVFLVAQSRGRTLSALRDAQQDLVVRTAIERESMQAQLEQSQRLDQLGRASVRTAHDMRSVFTIVRGCAAELAEDPDPSTQRKAEEMVGAVERGIEMLDELLAAGRAHSTPSVPLDLRRALTQAELLLGHLLRDGVVLRCNVPSRPLEVHLDRTSFMQIMLNLVGNAVDALDDHGNIHVAVREVHRHRYSTRSLEPCAVISVQDSGPGLSAGHGNVFDPGYTTKGDDHSGLGLSTVWRIAMRAGGGVEIDSQPDVGTTVSVFLPLAGQPTRPKRCFLGVENERAQSWISDELRQLGYEIQRVPRTGHGDDAGVDLAVIEVGHPATAAIEAESAKVFHLGRTGTWSMPLTSIEATQLVQRMIMEPAVSPS